MNIKPTLPYLAILLILLTGCSQNHAPKWLLGEWVFDTETTLQSVASSVPDKPQPADIFSALQSMVIPMLSTMELNISRNDIVTSFQGQKKLKAIKVYKQSPEQITIIQPDGVLIEYHKTDRGFWTTSDDGKLKIFFKRKIDQPDRD